MKEMVSDRSEKAIIKYTNAPDPDYENGVHGPLGYDNFFYDV